MTSEWRMDPYFTAKERVKTLPKETKQAILDDLHASLTVGEICAKHNLDTWIVWEVINENVESITTLRREAK